MSQFAAGNQATVDPNIRCSCYPLVLKSTDALRVFHKLVMNKSSLYFWTKFVYVLAIVKRWVMFAHAQEINADQESRHQTICSAPIAFQIWECMLSPIICRITSVCFNEMRAFQVLYFLPYFLRGHGNMQTLPRGDNKKNL